MGTPTIHDAQEFGERIASDLLDLAPQLSTQKEVLEAFLMAIGTILKLDEGLREAASHGFYIVLLGCEHLPADLIKPIGEGVTTVFTMAPGAVQ